MMWRLWWNVLVDIVKPARPVRSYRDRQITYSQGTSTGTMNASVTVMGPITIREPTTIYVRKWRWQP